MKPRYKRMTLDEHLEMADDLAIVSHYLMKVLSRCQKHYPKSSILMSNLEKVAPYSRTLGKIFSLLDDEYHKLITDEEFDKYGHIYYNREKRFEKISNKSLE